MKFFKAVSFLASMLVLLNCLSGMNCADTTKDQWLLTKSIKKNFWQLWFIVN